MDHATPVEVDARELERSQAFWNNFVTLTKYAIGAILGLLLVLMFIFFII